MASRKARSRHRSSPAAATALALLLLASTMLAGCIDTLFPKRPGEDEAPTDGLVRVWAATRPGAVGGEFVHYNVTFGGVAHGRDLLLEDLVPMQTVTPTVDLVHLERERKTVELARLFVPPGDYHGFGFFVSHVTLGVERVVGSSGGRAVTQIEEQAIEFSSSVTTPRAIHFAFPGRVTDLFIEIDLQRSLHRTEGGALRHTTVPAAVVVAVDNTKVAHHYMDGGLSGLDPDDPLRRDIDTDRETGRGQPPETSLQVFDTVTEARYYFDRTQANKRMSRTMGLGEDLWFDGSDSRSNYMRADRSEGTARFVPITEHIWDFGDGSTLDGPRVKKNYTKGGMYDVTLTVRDDKQNVAQDHVTLFVPYAADQAVTTREKQAEGDLVFGSGALDDEADTRTHSFLFPEDLEDGALRLGGYRVTLRAHDPLGGNLFGLQSTRVQVKSGHFQADETRFVPHEIVTAGLPVWRGPLKPWVDDRIDVTVQLTSGVLADYRLTVEAHYYYNLSRGLDPHAHHIHGPWPFGPHWNHLHWDGSVLREDE